MKKLELKHLAGYLPYELRYECNGVIYYYEHCSTRDFDYENSKPILRPLSDLMKKIELNGKTFVPKEVVDKECDWNYGTWYNMNSERIKKYCPYHFVVKLLEWHFDIHGLIEKGLAIDINTLK